MKPFHACQKEPARESLEALKARLRDLEQQAAAIRGPVAAAITQQTVEQLTQEVPQVGRSQKVLCFKRCLGA